MIYTPLQLDIIREFGKKELTEGALILGTDRFQTLRYVGYSEGQHCLKTEDDEGDILIFIERIEKETLGHIPHLEDVFRVADEKGWKCELEILTPEFRVDSSKHLLVIQITNSIYENLNFDYNPTIPLLEQDESTLTQLLNLFR